MAAGYLHDESYSEYSTQLVTTIQPFSKESVYLQWYGVHISVLDLVSTVQRVQKAIFWFFITIETILAILGCMYSTYKCMCISSIIERQQRWILGQLCCSAVGRPVVCEFAAIWKKVSWKKRGSTYRSICNLYRRYRWMTITTWKMLKTRICKWHVALILKGKSSKKSPLKDVSKVDQSNPALPF